MSRPHELLRAIALSLRLGFARPRHHLLTIAGLLIASLTLMAVLMIPAGLSRIASSTGRADVAVILASPRGDESEGNIAPERVQRIGALPGVARAADGAPLLAEQFVAHVKLPRRDGMPATAIVRGSDAKIWSVVGDEAHIDKGKAFGSAVNEMVAGSVAARRYLYAQAGSPITMTRSIWQVSGEFSAHGNLWESEFWADLDALRAIYNAQGQTTAIWLRLDGSDGYARLTEAMQADPQLRGLQLMRQADFYARRVGFVTLFARTAAWVIALLLGLQAVLVSHNAVGLSLRARRRELAVLRAVGFERGALLAALLIETLLLAALCAAIALVLGYFFLDGRGIDSSTLDASIHFTTAITGEVLISTLAYALMIGLASALIPAWSALRAPLAPALAGE
ncbi:MAG: ABC transporter permease [Dokdonella sp.]|uniref:ABC transporter permease n=1 Tax=Dokdonella sp. TaxID=2291710 RepID=UPI0025B8FAD4|nr:ABC transporter permease [Dokdonella sp.]MBZ0221887.1 ABC transporter permease [Dokdonella sp.]